MKPKLSQKHTRKLKKIKQDLKDEIVRRFDFDMDRYEPSTQDMRKVVAARLGWRVGREKRLKLAEYLVQYAKAKSSRVQNLMYGTRLVTLEKVDLEGARQREPEWDGESLARAHGGLCE